MPETSHAEDADRVAGLDALEGGEGGGASALKGSGVDIAETHGNGIQERLPPDGVGCKAALVEILDAVQSPLGAVCFGPLEAFGAVATAVGLVAPADVIAFLQGVARWADGLDNADTLVAEDHVCAFLFSR